MSDFMKSAFLLIAFASISIATSYKKDIPTVTKSYNLTSTCANASLNSGTIRITDGQMSSPAGFNLLNVGFPSVGLTVGDGVSADIGGGVVRACIYSSTAVANQITSIYNCSDNGFLACTITLVHLD